MNDAALATIGSSVSGVNPKTSKFCFGTLIVVMMILIFIAYYEGSKHAKIELEEEMYYNNNEWT